MQTVRTGDEVAEPETEQHTAEARRLEMVRVIATASPAWLIAASATAVLAVAASVHDQVPLGSGLAVAVLSVAAVIDIYERRLPNILVITAAAVLIAGVLIEAAFGGLDVALLDITCGATAFGGPLLLLHMIAPDSMGFGDVKTGIVLGAAIGAIDWQLALVGLAVAAGLTATVGVFTRASTIAFGPGLVAASAIALAAHPLFLTDMSQRGDTELTISAIAAPGQEIDGDPHD